MDHNTVFKWIVFLSGELAQIILKGVTLLGSVKFGDRTNQSHKTYAI